MIQDGPGCTRCGSEIEAGDMRCPVCFLAVPTESLATDLAVRVQVLRCGSCGAAIEYRAASRAPQCAFCRGVLELEERVDPVEQPEMRLPFTVSRDGAVEAYRGWLSRQGFFCPSDLSSASKLESLEALWWVGWMVDADAFVTWTADTNAGARKAEWAPHAGELHTVFDDLVIPATRGLSLEECGRLLGTYDMSRGLDGGASGDGSNGAAAENAPAGEGFADPSSAGSDERSNDDASDFVRERFDMQRSDARGRILAAIQELCEDRIRRDSLPGSRVRNFQAAIHLRGLLTRRVAFPAYVLAYRYRRRLHRTVISGQDPACVIGKAPRSLLKIALVVAAVTIAVGALALALVRFAG